MRRIGAQLKFNSCTIGRKFRGVSAGAEACHISKTSAHTSDKAAAMRSLFLSVKPVPGHCAHSRRVVSITLTCTQEKSVFDISQSF